MVLVLVLAIVSLFVAGREVQAKEQPAERESPQQQHSKVVTNDRKASKSDAAKEARDDAEEARSERQPEEEASPPPVSSVPLDPETIPEPAPIPALQTQFAVIVVNGQVVWFDGEAPWPSWPVPDTAPAEPLPSWPVPEDAWPTPPQPTPSDQYEPQKPVWEPDPVPQASEGIIIGSASDPAPWSGSGEETPLLAPASEDIIGSTSDLAPLPASSEDLAPTANHPDPTPSSSSSSSWPTLSFEPIASLGEGSLRSAPYEEPAVELPVTVAPPVVLDTGLESAATAKNNLPAHVAPPAAPLLPSPGRKPLATPPATPPPTPAAMSSFQVGGWGMVTSTVGNAAEAVRSAAALAAASVAAEVSSAIAGRSVEFAPNVAQDPSQGTPQQQQQQPAPPLTPPMGGSSFSLSGGSGGQAGPGGGAAPLLLGILASVLVLRRPDCWKYLASCDLPKPSSALLLPLERPG